MWQPWSRFLLFFFKCKPFVGDDHKRNTVQFMLMYYLENSSKTYLKWVVVKSKLMKWIEDYFENPYGQYSGGKWWLPCSSVLDSAGLLVRSCGTRLQLSYNCLKPLLKYLLFGSKSNLEQKHKTTLKAKNNYVLTFVWPLKLQARSREEKTVLGHLYKHNGLSIYFLVQNVSWNANFAGFFNNLKSMIKSQQLRI